MNDQIMLIIPFSEVFQTFTDASPKWSQIQSIEIGLIILIAFLNVD